MGEPPFEESLKGTLIDVDDYDCVDEPFGFLFDCYLDEPPELMLCLIIFVFNGLII